MLLLSAGTPVLESFGVQMLQQLFELEMCIRETKNRTHTPLSQLPLRCLCVFLLLFQSAHSPLPFRLACCFFTLLVFWLSFESKSGLVCPPGPVLALNTWNWTPLPLTVVLYPVWWETGTLIRWTEIRRPMSLRSDYLRSLHKDISPTKRLMKVFIYIRSSFWKLPKTIIFCSNIGWTAGFA